ncbi:TonB-dependent receptor domain-containing protein [Shewanella algae]|uniref:TonB-dependent receptor domain-containing protein n=1 Tax=Shewanella algae TaxID=38313 RepID=UPI00300758A1
MKLDKCRKLLTLSLVAMAVSGYTQADEGEMEHMVVTASAKDQQLSTAPASISVIDAEAIKLMPVKDLGDVLRNSVGVNVVTNDSGRNSIYIRGMDEDYVLMLINGKRVSSSNGLWRGGNFDLTAIPIDAISRVEIVRGPMSALYGSDAVGGVINVITKALDDDWQLVLDSEYSWMQDGEGGDRSRTNLFGSGKLTDNLGLMFTAEVAEQDAWLMPELTPNQDTIEERKTRKLYGSLTWQLADNQSLDLDYQYDNDKVPLTTFAANSKREQKIERNTFALTHRGEWSWGGTELLANLEKSDIYDYNSRYSLQPPLGRDIEEKNTTFRGSAFFNLWQQDWTVGAEYFETEVDDPVQYPLTGGDSVEQYSLFIQDQFDFLDDFTLTLGGRYEDNEKYGSHFSPRAYLVYRASDALVLKGGVGTAFRAPALFESSPTFSSVSCRGACTVVGNADLEPETSVNYELAALWSQPSYELSATLFHNKVEDLITVSAWDGSSPTRTYYNESKVTLQGVELTASVDITADLGLKANYSYLDTETGDGDELTGRPRQSANVQLDWYLTDDWQLYVAGNYFGSYLDSSAVRQDGYSRFDIGSSYRVNDHLKLRAGVTNFTDEQPAEEDTNSDMILQGRAFFVGVSLSL